MSSQPPAVEPGRDAAREALTAKQRYDANGINEEEEPDPLERLRFFLSFALNGQDWIDVEPFLDAVSRAVLTGREK